MFEGSMYTFVFMWGPVLEKGASEEIPFGVIFAAFMVCIMIGSIGFRVSTTNYGMTVEKLAPRTYFLLTMVH